MRILLLNWRDKTDAGYGGAEDVAERLAIDLSKHAEVTFFTSDATGKGNETKGTIKVIRRGSINSVYFRGLEHMARNRRKYDAVIESVSSVPFFSPLVFESDRIFIIIHHLLRRKMFAVTNPVKAVAAYAAETSIPLLYRNAKFFVFSKFVRSQLESMGIRPGSIRLISMYGPNVGRASAQKYREPTVITVGRLVKYKRTDMIIRMFAKLKVRVPSARLVVVGAGPEIGRLKRLAQSMGLGKSVRFTGFISEKRKMYELGRSWVFATASLIEGFGISALEAQMCGLPVVAFGNGGLNEAVKDGYSGFLLKEGDSAGFVSKLELLLEDPDGKLARMSRNAGRFTKSQRLDEAGKDILDSIERSLNARAQHSKTT